MKRTLWLACVLLVLAGLPARADRIVTVRPGPEGEDSAPYGFFPALVRGGYDTLYAFVGADDNGAEHGMQTFLRFELPQGLLGPNERVVSAQLRITYAFDFEQYGNVNDEPGNLRCHVVTQPWSEATLTWMNRPAFDPPFHVLDGITSFRTLGFDVTAQVSGWATGALPNYGVALTSTTERVLGFYAFERTGIDPNVKPYLVIRIGPSALPDADADGVADASDNCPQTPNAAQADEDLDGVGDACDDCTHVANADQRDTDADGFGNACDADFDQNGIVNFGDLAKLKRAFFTTGPDLVADLDGNGTVNFADLARLKQSLFQAPGPSGVAP